MKRYMLLASLIAYAALASAMPKIVRSYVQQPLSEVLIDIDKAFPEVRITFIYNKLEDYPVTCSINSASPIEAIQTAIGFYPVKATAVEGSGKDKDGTTNIIVEPLYDTDTKLSGHIVDEEGQPMECANITLLSTADSTFIGGGVANASGDFVIPCQHERVLLKASFIGYRTVTRECAVGNVGEICLKEEMKRLAEVRKNGTRQLARMERGALVYDMQLLNSVMPADNAYEALTRIPAVSDSDDKLTFAGQDVTLVINGKATTLTSEQIKERLERMPVERLAKAEVMMSAPARYHAHGLVINVVTREMYGHKELSGQLQGTGTFSNRSQGSGVGSLLFSQGRFALDAMYSQTNGKQLQKVEHYGIHPLATGPQEYHDCNKSDVRHITHNYRLGMEYFIAPNHNIELAYNGRWKSMKYHNTATGSTVSEQKSITHNYLHNADLNYSAPFGLKLGASYTNFRYPQRQNLEGSIGDERKDYTSESGQDIEKWNLTADQTHSFAKAFGLSYGAQMQLTRHHSWQQTHLPSGEEVSQATSSISYTERISSFYASLSKELGKDISAEIGAQAEHYSTEHWNQWRIYPSLNVLWNANGNNSINLSFSSDSHYPDYWSLMNNVYYSSSYSEIWGNPGLKPQSGYTATLLWLCRKRYTLQLHYTCIKNDIQQLPYQTYDRMAVIMQEVNFNFRKQAGMTVTAQWKAGKWANGNIGCYYGIFHDKHTQFHDIPFDRKKWSGQLFGNIVLTPWPSQNMSLIAEPMYQFNTIQGVYDIKNFFRINAALKWTDKSRRFTASLKGVNLTNMHYTTSDTWKGQNYAMAYWYAYTSLQLSLTYRLGNYKNKDRKAVDTSRMGH